MIEAESFQIREAGKGAVISDCGLYRYALWRVWNLTLPLILFIMLNPSKADAFIDDPTIRRCIGFAVSLKAGGFLVGNLFAFRATRVRDMKRASMPVGADNDRWLSQLSTLAQIKIAAWGVHGNFMGRDREVCALIPQMSCLGTTKDGRPRHPLFLRRTCKPSEFELPALMSEVTRWPEREATHWMN